MKGLRGSNIVAIWGDSNTISNSLAEELVDKYMPKQSEGEGSDPDIVLKYIYSLEDSGLLEDADLVTHVIERFGLTPPEAEEQLAIYRESHPSMAPRESKKIASKAELVELGLTSIGTGLYKDSAHHIWNLKREGDGYSIERESDEEEMLSMKYSSKKRIAREVTLEGASPEDTNAFLQEMGPEGEGLYFSESGSDGTSTKISIDETDFSHLYDQALSRGIRVSKTAEMEISKKVFSPEALTTGISHYTNMGFSEKEAIGKFIESHQLDKKEYESDIKDLLAKYKENTHECE